MTRTLNSRSLQTEKTQSGSERTGFLLELWHERAYFYCNN